MMCSPACTAFERPQPCCKRSWLKKTQHLIQNIIVYKRDSSRICGPRFKKQKRHDWHRSWNQQMLLCAISRYASISRTCFISANLVARYQQYASISKSCFNRPRSTKNQRVFASDQQILLLGISKMLQSANPASRVNIQQINQRIFASKL